MKFRLTKVYGATYLALAIGCSDPCHVATPKIVTQPQSQTVKEGQAVTFHVGHGDNSQVSGFQWQKNGTNYGPLKTIDGDLVINPVSLSDAGTYTVIVTYYSCRTERSTTSSPAILTVTAPA